MALTMTRNLTQTTLTKLALLVANIHGELAFLEELRQTVASEEVHLQQMLERRYRDLVEQHEALRLTMRQFDPNLYPDDIGPSNDWRKRFGRIRTIKTLQKKYLAALG